MGKIVLNKLVRDKVLENIEKNGEFALYETLDDEAFVAALDQKLLEEAKEVTESKTKNKLMEELADLQEVLYAIVKTNGIEYKDIEASRIKISEQIRSSYNSIVDLNKKLLEVARKVINAKTKEMKIKQLASLQELLYITTNANGIEYRYIEEARVKKLQQKGGFSKRIFLIHTIDKYYVDANNDSLTCKNGSGMAHFNEK